MACDLSQYTDFQINLDASKDAVNATHIEAFVDGPGDANRLLIFTGSANVNRESDNDDDLVRRGTVRLKLNFPLSSAITFVDAATNASLGSIFNRDDDDTTYAIDCVSPQPENTDPNNPQQSELVLTAAVAVQGGENDAGINRMAYQANVLLRDTEPELQSVLVRQAGVGNFVPEVLLFSGDKWEYLFTLTGPVPVGQFFTVTLQSSDPQDAPIDILHVINEVPAGQISAGSGPVDPVVNRGNLPLKVTITGTGKGVSKTAILDIATIPR
jgi:hypothetical protein